MLLPIFLLPLIAAVVMTALGYVWFGPIFGRFYGSAMGVTPEMMASGKKSMIPKMILDFVMSFIMFLGFLMILNIAQAGTYSSAILFGSLFWVFIIMPNKASSIIWGNRGTKDSWVLFGISAGYSLVSFVLTAILFIALVPVFI